MDLASEIKALHDIGTKHSVTNTKNKSGDSGVYTWQPSAGGRVGRGWLVSSSLSGAIIKTREKRAIYALQGVLGIDFVVCWSNDDYGELTTSSVATEKVWAPGDLY